MIQLLYTFKKNMTDTLRNQNTDKGLSGILIDKIIGYAGTFNEYKANQEGLKQTTKEISKEVANAFNGIYGEIIEICKMVSNYYQFDAVKKERFTFSKVISNLGLARKTTTETEPVDAPQVWIFRFSIMKAPTLHQHPCVGVFVLRK